MLESTLSERALRQAWRQADLEVARSLAAFCYGKARTADAEHLSQSVVAATRQRRELAARLEESARLRVVAAPADPVVTTRPAEQIRQAITQTRALQPSGETSSLSLLRQRLSAA